MVEEELEDLPSISQIDALAKQLQDEELRVGSYHGTAHDLAVSYAEFTGDDGPLCALLRGDHDAAHHLLVAVLELTGRP
jgi:hypothetical protein